MPEQDVIELDILVVGAGPAGLSAALRLAQLQKGRGGPRLAIAVLEKGREAGAHELSGAILDPSTLSDLVPDFAARGAPLACPVRSDALHWLTSAGQWRLPFTPPPLSNHGNYVISLNAFVRWLSTEVEAAGVDLLSGVSAAEVLYDGPRVIGVRTRDLGLDKHGGHKPSFEPGAEIRAKVTIFCDGVRGNLTKALVRDLQLDNGRQSQLYALGLKELWELPQGRLRPGETMHTLGHPLTTREFGGGFVYGMQDRLASIGFVAGLDYEDPRFDPYVAFQRFKQHPFVSRLLEGGTRVRYGAKALPEGGWHTIPRVHMDGALIAGDAGGFLNSLRLKGIHLAMRTGMLAGDAAFDAVTAGDTSRERLASYQRAIDAGHVRRELYPARNVHQAFQRGVVSGLAFSAWSLISGGWWFSDPMPSKAGYARMRTLADGSHETPSGVAIDRRTTFDRTTSVHYSGTRHREDEPPHLLVHDTDICRTRCVVEYGNPCTRFCPASVYDMVDDGNGGRRLQISASNCVHCKACDIMDPYQIIDWVPPEGGEGPQYEGM